MNTIQNKASWVERNPFWADTLRTIILGIVGTLLVATVIELLKNRIGYAAEKNKARLSLKVDVIKDFSERSYKFTSLAVRFNEGQISFEELRDAFDNYRNIQHQMNIALKNTYVNERTQIIANKMLLILANKDSQVPKSVTFENIRTDIKKICDTVEVYALEKL
jgi:hypothetical protein